MQFFPNSVSNVQIGRYRFIEPVRGVSATGVSVQPMVKRYTDVVNAMYIYVFSVVLRHLKMLSSNLAVKIDVFPY